MGYWIEVTTGIRWNRMLEEGDIRLDAPNVARYRGFFKGLKAGDFVLHYLTGTLTSMKSKKSCIVCVSKVESSPAIIGNRIVAKCSGLLELPKPVSYKELCALKEKSAQLAKLLKMGMQRYLTQISRSDFESILGVHPANMKHFLKSPLAGYFYMGR